MTQKHRRARRLTALVTLFALSFMPSAAAGQQDLGQLSLEELMAIEVTTVSRAPELSMAVPAALFVITEDDIRQSGAASLPEVLRLAPGVQVARIDAGKWAIGVRGFADRLSRSMLVLIDGRPVYSPLFAGTYWETQHVPLEDVQRVEVIRGPGGTLWGSNAVNGIVSIVTKSARETQGVLASGAAGSAGRAHGTIRYGGRLGARNWARGYVSGFQRDGQAHTGPLEYDGWRLIQGGFRFDSELSGDRALTVQGDLYTSRIGEYVRESSYEPPFVRVSAADVPLSGGNLSARWSSPVGADTEFDAQASVERSKREEYPVNETRETLNLDAQLRHYSLDRHRIVVGAGYQVTSGEIVTAPVAELPSGSEQLFSGFAEDEVSFASERLRLGLGVKLEHNDYSGWEVQPSVRATWLPDPSHTAWVSVTRAVRRPSRVERAFRREAVLDPSVPSFFRLVPNPDFQPEKLTAYEAGYRTRPTSSVYLSVATFYNHLDDLLSTELSESFQESGPPGPDRLVLPVSFGNGLDGTSYGGEVTVDTRPTLWWRSVGHYSFLRVFTEPKPGTRDISQASRYENGSPRHQLRIQNSLSLPGRVTLDWHLRHVSELSNPAIPAYTTSDLRMGWGASDAVSVELVGRNLHQPRHLEWAGDGGPDVAIERSFFLGLTWRQ